MEGRGVKEGKEGGRQGWEGERRGSGRGDRVGKREREINLLTTSK